MVTDAAIELRIVVAKAKASGGYREKVLPIFHFRFCDESECRPFGFRRT